MAEDEVERSQSEEEQVDSENDQEEIAGSDGSQEEEDGEGEGEGIDGMADMMSKILHQQVGRKIPVLAKRKTTIMKELEQEYADRDRLKKLKIARKEARDKHLVLPQALSADYERQLRKIATRGVVALFNAIAKSKREESETAEDTSKSKKPTQAKAKDVMEMSRSNFLDLLKGGGSTQETIASDTSKKSLKAKESESEEDEDDGLGATSWSVLKESYLTDKKLALKDWDKEDESDFSEGEGDEEEPQETTSKSSKKKRASASKPSQKGKKQKTGGGGQKKR